MKHLLLFLALTLTSHAAVQLIPNPGNGSSFIEFLDQTGYSVIQTSIEPGEWRNFQMTGMSPGDTIVSLKLDGYWTNPGQGWTGPEELHYGIGDVMQVRVPNNATATVEQVALISVAHDYNGRAQSINMDPTIQDFFQTLEITHLRDRRGNTDIEATVGLGSPIPGDSTITCDFDADWSGPKPIHPPIPEPTSLSLLLLGLALILRRRR